MTERIEKVKCKITVVQVEITVVPTEDNSKVKFRRHHEKVRKSLSSSESEEGMK